MSKWRDHYDTEAQRDMERTGFEVARMTGNEPLSRQQRRALKRKLSRADASMAQHEERKAKRRARRGR